MDEIKIEKGFAIPEVQRYGVYMKLAEKMEVGDSVLLKTRSRTVSLIQSGRRRKKAFISRKVSNGYRVWYVGPMEK